MCAREMQPGAAQRRSFAPSWLDAPPRTREDVTILLRGARVRRSYRSSVKRLSSQTYGYNAAMTTAPLGEVKDRLSEYVAGVERTHDRVTITRHGRPAAVLVSPDDLAALEETVEVLTTPGATEAITEGLADLAAGRVADNEALRARFAPR